MWVLASRIRHCPSDIMYQSASGRRNLVFLGCRFAAMVQKRRRSTPTPQKGVDVAPRARVGATLLDIADDEQMRSEKKRVRSTRDNHGAVQKCIRDNYSTLSSSDIDMKKINGVTLRDTLPKAKEDTVTMGKKFHDELREKFAPTDAKIGGLVIRDLSEPDDNKLKSALMKFFKHHREVTPLQVYLQTSGMPSQKTFVVLCRAMLKVAPTRCIVSANLLIDFLGYCKRHKLNSKFAAEFSRVKPTLELALQRSYSFLKGEGQKIGTWWRSVEHAADLILPKEQMDKVTGCTTSWIEVESDLQCLLDASPLAAVVFSAGVSWLAQRGAEKLLHGAAQELRGKNLTQKFLDSLLASLKQKFAEKHIDFRAPFLRKVVKFRYRLQEVEAYCMSHFDHWMLLQEAHVKTVALQNNLLPPLFCEDELAPLSPTDTQCTVEPALLERNLRAREAASEYLPLASEHTGPNISHLMSKRILALLQLDRFFKIEAAFFLGQVGAAAEQRVKKMVLECLPSVDAPAKKTIEGSLEALERLATQRIITFSGPGPAAALQSVLEIVRALSEHAKPRFENYSNCSFFSEAKQRCELLANYKEKAPSGKLLVGREAAVAMLGDLQKASSGASEDKKVAYNILTGVERYDWMLTGDEQRVLLDLKRGYTISKREGGASSSTDKPKKVGGKKKDFEDESIAALFRN